MLLVSIRVRNLLDNRHFLISSDVGRENIFERSLGEGSPLVFAKERRGEVLPAGAVTVGRDMLLPLEQCLARM